MSNFWHYIFAILGSIVTLSFIRTPFTNDVGIFQGVANIADKYYPFPYGVDLAWEAKPIGNRLINYGLLKITEIFTPFESQDTFIIVAKILVLLAVIIIAAYFSYIIKGEYTFWLIFFAFTTCINFCIMQAEWYASLLAVLTIALVIDKRYILAGLLIFFIATIKGITLFLFVPIVCSVYLLHKLEQKAIAKVLAGFLIGGCAAVILQLIIWPNMMPDLLLAPYITGVGRMPFWDSVQYFVIQTVLIVGYIPVLASAFTGLMLILAARKYTGWNLAAFVLMWLVPLLTIIIHSEYFAYQFFVYSVPAITTVILCARFLGGYVSKNPAKTKIASSLIIISILAMFVMFAFLNSDLGFMTKTERDFFGQQNNYADDIETLFHISAEESVLYLDAGVAPYYFHANSTSRYICPLPLQRSSQDWNIWDKPQVQQTYADALAYNGTYVIGDGAFGYHDWLHLEYDDRKELREKLEREYRIEWTKGWTIYKRIQD